MENIFKAMRQSLQVIRSIVDPGLEGNPYDPSVTYISSRKPKDRQPTTFLRRRFALR